MVRDQNAHSFPPESFPPELGDEADADELERVWNRLSEPRVTSSPEALDAAWALVRDRMGEVDVQPTEPTALAEAEAAPIDPTPLARAEAEAAPVQATVHSHPDAASPARSGARWWVRGLLAAAVVAALALGLGPLTSVTIEAGPGESRSVTLADGTRVALNSGSSLVQPRWSMPWSAPAREVVLVGEAFFEVTPDEVPFQVETFNARVTVLGTQFNVRARDEVGGGTEVVLERGRVRLEGSRSQAGVELAPGQMSSVALGEVEPAPPEPVDVEPLLSWRVQGFAAVDRPLGAILAELERRHGVEIRIGPDVDPDDRLTLLYQESRDLRGILGDIATARGLRFRETSQGFELY